MPGGASRGGSAGSAFQRASSSVTSPGTSASRGTSSLLADALDATFVAQIYSRLVIDCNRDLAVPSSIVEISEHDHGSRQPEHRPTPIGARRQEEIFWPYHDRDRRAARPPEAAGQRDGARRHAQLHAGLQGRRAGRGMSACSITATRASRASSSTSSSARATSTSATTSHIASATHRLHDSRAWREPRPAACRDRDPPGPDRRGVGPARLGGPLSRAPARSARRYRRADRLKVIGERPSRYAYPSTRDLPVEIAATTLLFIDVQNFCAVRNGGEFKACRRRNSRRHTAISSARWKAASFPTCSACRPAAARPASR